MGSHHHARLIDRIRRTLTELIQTGIDDERLSLASVTKVELSSDRRYATAYLSVMGDEEEARDALSAVERAAGHLRSELARRVSMRHTPEIRWRLDMQERATTRIEELLREADADREGTGE